jgi:CheY-like chemotaxis protein
MNVEPGITNPTAVSTPNGAHAHHRPGILIADDMGLILALFKIELELQGFDVWLAEDGYRAIDLYRSHKDHIDIVLLDVQMPGMDGPQTLAGLRDINDHLLVCFMTGGMGDYRLNDLLARGAASVFRKPFRFTEIARHLLALVDSADAGVFHGRN